MVSVILTLSFRGFANSHIGPNAFTENPYVIFVLFPGVLVVAAILAAAAAFWGSRWWLLALLGPVSGGLLMLAART
jgi:hypothetical protein